MAIMRMPIYFCVAGACFATALTGAAQAADPRSVDWSAIPPKALTLFYPGGSTYDWLTSREHKGARLVAQGKACVACHEADEKDGAA